VDIQRIVDVLPYLNMVWSAPMQIVGAVYFLWQELGPSVLAGLATMVFLIPVNGWVAAKTRTFQIKQMKEKDKRVKQMNEILQGMKVREDIRSFAKVTYVTFFNLFFQILKLYAWEPSFRDQVSDIRHREIALLKQMS